MLPCLIHTATQLLNSFCKRAANANTCVIFVRHAKRCFMHFSHKFTIYPIFAMAAITPAKGVSLEIKQVVDTAPH